MTVGNIESSRDQRNNFIAALWARYLIEVADILNSDSLLNKFDLTTFLTKIVSVTLLLYMMPLYRMLPCIS